MKWSRVQNAFSILKLILLFTDPIYATMLCVNVIPHFTDCLCYPVNGTEKCFKGVDDRLGLLNETALHYAAKMNIPECINILVNNKADINVQNTDGKTALAIVAEKAICKSVTDLENFMANHHGLNERQEDVVKKCTKIGK